MEKKTHTQFSPKAQPVSEEKICSSAKRGSRAVFFSEGSQTYGVGQQAASNFGGEETTTEEIPAARSRFVETF